MSTPNFSRQFEWNRLVQTRLNALEFCQRASQALTATVSANAVISIATKMGEFIVAASRVDAFSTDQLAAVVALAKDDTGDTDYDLVANATALKQAAQGIIALCRAALPSDEDGYITVLQIDANGSQTVTQLTTTDTASLKGGIDQLITALGG